MMRYGTFALSMLFQSTLSVRRATIVKITEGGGYVFQSTLSVRRATYGMTTVRTGDVFQSTLSVRRATARLVGVVQFQLISIHALREESDPTHGVRPTSPPHFNPRSP